MTMEGSGGYKQEAHPRNTMDAITRELEWCTAELEERIVIKA